MNVGFDPTRFEEFTGFGFQLFQHGMQGRTAHGGGKQRLSDLPLLLQDFLPAPDQCLMIDAEQHLEHLGANTMEKWRQRIVHELATVRRQQGILVALAPDDGELMAVMAPQCAANPEVLVLVPEVVGRPRRDAEQQRLQTAQRGTLARLIGPVDDVQPASGRGKIQQPVAERAKGKQVEFPDLHYASTSN